MFTFVYHSNNNIRNLSMMETICSTIWLALAQLTFGFNFCCGPSKQTIVVILSSTKYTHLTALFIYILFVCCVVIPIKWKCPTVLLQSTDFIMTRLALIKQINFVTEEKGFVWRSRKKITLHVTFTRLSAEKLSAFIRDISY